MYKFDKFEVMPLFACPISIVRVDEDLSELEAIKEENYLSSKSGNQMTADDRILNRFPYTKQVLKRYLDYYVHEIIEHGNIDIRFTTSWGTKNDRHSLSGAHIHRNSLYSGVFYYSDTNEGDMIQFFRPIMNTIFTAKEEKHTIFNSDMWQFNSTKNTLLLFPSHVPHRLIVGPHDQQRWSLAFNTFPSGNFGDGDSSIELEVK